MSRPTVQNFSGALDGVRARKGVLITTGGFTREAEEYAKGIDKRIILVDGERLTELMIEHGVGVLEKQTYRVMQINPAYFDE